MYKKNNKNKRKTIMKITVTHILLCGVLIMLITQLNSCNKQQSSLSLADKAFNNENIASIFSLTPEQINTDTLLYIKEAQQNIDLIIAIPDNQRTFENTAKALDNIFALSNMAIAKQIYEAFELLHPDAHVRETAQTASLTIKQFIIDHILINKMLYNAFVAYLHGNAKTEKLSDQQRYFLVDMEQAFKREGLALSDETLATLAALKKEISELETNFERNIAQDKTTITVSQDQLQGVPESFIASLKRTDDDLYILGHDYPTYFTVMQNCSDKETRKNLYRLFNNRAYPENDAVLKTIIAKRDELAKLLSYTNFAQFDLANQMVETPERAYAFLQDLIKQAATKVNQEIANLTAQLPASVILTENGTIKPWDIAYLENEYKKKKFNIDEQLIADYFPMENTIKELLDIYRQFLGIEFKEMPISNLWSDDITAIQVINKETSQLLGTLFLDLYPRPNKYNHAAHTTIIPATITSNGKHIPGVSIVIANFPHATIDKPSVLTRDFVKTFFHEFGHALHAIFGATPIASLSGTATKCDFVELPSQMLEEWLNDKAILQKVSMHYKTGEQLPDEIIDSIIALKNAFSGYFVTRQAYLSTLALDYFATGATKDLHAIAQANYETIVPFIEFDHNSHMYASFGHLTGYAAKYYGYLWSKIFALDLFAEIKKHGLLNPIIGKKYTQEILSKGGSQDPNELLYAFLGREPNAQAFFETMEL